MHWTSYVLLLCKMEKSLCLSETNTGMDPILSPHLLCLLFCLLCISFFSLYILSAVIFHSNRCIELQGLFAIYQKN